MRSNGGRALGLALVGLLLVACGSDDNPQLQPDSGITPDGTVTRKDGTPPVDTITPDTITPDMTTADAGADAALPTLRSVGLSGSAIDDTADPCQDFFQYACGKWLQDTTIPADELTWSRTFNEIDKRNEELLKTALENAAGSSDAVMQKVGAYYAACMDEAAVQTAGTAAIDPLLAQIDAMASVDDMPPVMADLHMIQAAPVFIFFTDGDFMDPTKVILYLYQWGLGLGDRERYLSEETSEVELRATYQTHVQAMLELAGLSEADAIQGAQDVMDLETAIATASKTMEQMRDVMGTYNKVDRAGLKTTAPNFDWDAYFTAMGYPGLVDISITGTEFFEAFSDLLSSQPLRVWKNYFKWQLLDRMSPYMPQAFVDEHFVLMQALYGVEQQQERWKRCVSQTTFALPDYVGQAYAATAFGPAAKTAADEMAQAIQSAFDTELDGLAWMDEATRTAAKAKLAKVDWLLGIPDMWQHYAFPVDPADYCANEMEATIDYQRRGLDKVGGTVQRDEWFFPVSMVNAFYNPVRNVMTFPAGILQPPFFDKDAAAAVNLGSIGYVIAHELTHGFDDQGANFDGDGLFSPWWSEGTKTEFETRTGCIEDQYEAYEWLPDLPIDGAVTLGENIADNGGTKFAYRAYRALRAGQTPMTVEGYSEDQLFFLAVGQSWCMKGREAFWQTMAAEDVHSPPHARVNGPLSNMPEFAAAFSCAADTPMNPTDKCAVW